MGIQDRDYYREWWAKKTGYVERAKFRLPEQKPRLPWHWSLQLLATLVLCTVVFAVLKGVARLLA